jgi:hypothetical protein
MAGSGDGRTGPAVPPVLKIVLVAVALLVAAYLVATDRNGWFKLRPASGSAAAIAQASDKADAR